MCPRHDPVPKVPAGGRTARGAVSSALARSIRDRVRRGPRGDGEPGGEPCPVDPNRPLDLSGGAAASLEFDD